MRRCHLIIFFRNVNLGPHEEPIKQALLNNISGDTNWYSVVFSVWVDRDRNPGLIDPFREKMDGVNYYRFYLSRYIMYIKVDKQNSVGSMKSVELKEGSPLYLVSREFEKSKEFSIMIKMAQIHVK